MYKNKEALDKNPLTDKALELGKVKWFGGLNNKTGRTNEFGFIDASGEDLYFHKSDILSVATAFIPDAEVVFFRTESRKGPAAVSVQALAQASDDEIVALVRESRGLSPLQFLKLITLRTICKSPSRGSLTTAYGSTWPVPPVSPLWQTAKARSPSRSSMSAVTS